MSLEENVNRWLNIDNKIKEQNILLKDLRETRNDLEDNISNYAKEHNISNLSIKTKEGLLKLVNVKNTSPLTFKYIEQCLNEIFDEEKTNEIINYLKEKRTTTYSNTIKKNNIRNE